MRNGGEEARIVRGMCDVCVAHGDRATVSVDVDAKQRIDHRTRKHVLISTTRNKSSDVLSIGIPFYYR